MNRNQLMAQLLLSHMLGPRPVTVEEWYSTLPYKKIEPQVAAIMAYSDNDGVYHIVVGRKGKIDDSEDKDEIISELSETYKTPEDTTRMMYDLARSMPCVPIETEEGFDYPFFDEGLYRRLTQADERREKRAKKIAENFKRTYEGQCHTDE